MDRVLEPRKSRQYHSDEIAGAAARYTTSVSGVEVPLGTTGISPPLQRWVLCARKLSQPQGRKKASGSHSEYQISLRNPAEFNRIRSMPTFSKSHISRDSSRRLCGMF
jgi:hypothetical protein